MLLLAAAAAFTLAVAAPAQNGTRPTVSGNPVVGETLTSSDAGDTAVYKWERCDPAVDTCVDADADDDNWSHIAGANSQSYTLTSADLGSFVRVVAKGTSLGTKFVSSAPVGPVTATSSLPVPATSSQAAALPGGRLTPIHGVQLLGEPVGGGTVLVKFRGQSGFSPLTQLQALPVGTVVDTRGTGSRIRLISATGVFGSTSPDQSIDFYLGLFKIVQPSAMNSNATAKLVEKLGCGKGNDNKPSASAAGPAATVAARRRRRLWGSGSGSYSTSGSGGSGSVKGTTWVQTESCNRAKWRVTGGEGIIVDPKGPKENIELGPGEKFSIQI